MAESSDTTRTMKRRGLIAGAAALVAGGAAKRASEPVAASSGFGADGPLVLGSNDDPGNSANYTNARTQVISGLGNPTGTGFRGKVLFDCSASPFQSSGDANVVGMSGVSRGSAAGVYGADTTNKPSGFPADMNAGVYGYAYNQGHSGVRGDGGSFGMGVSGVSFNSNAILGTTLSSTFNANAAILGLGYGVGVQGNVPGGSQANTIAVYGNNTSTGSNASGVVGTSTTGSGVLGGTMSATAGTAGGYYYNTADNGSGVVGQVFSSTGAVAFVGAASPPNYAAYFTGTVVVQGPLVVTDPSYKSGALAHPDGSHRLVYCVESPESWIEDVGTGTLSGGKATITFDKDFAAVTHTDTYHVFLTEYTETQGLFVSNRSAAGFTVQERNKGATSGTFSWRVMVKAKSSVKSERLGKFTMPSIKLADKPPHVPDVPTAPTPPKKP